MEFTFRPATPRGTTRDRKGFLFIPRWCMNDYGITTFKWLEYAYWEEKLINLAEDSWAAPNSALPNTLYWKTTRFYISPLTDEG